MSATVMQASPAQFDPSATGSLFSCSRSDIPCHHFCLRHSKPLNQEVEEWFMTDEVEEKPAEDEQKQEGVGLNPEEEEEEDDEDRDMMEAGLLDQLLDEAYAQYYDEPDEWEELAQWYTTRINCDEPWEGEEQEDQSSGAVSSGAAYQRQEDFHPAWRQDVAGTSSLASTSHGGQRRSSEPQPTSNGQPHATKRRDWAEMADEQDREEAMELSSNTQQLRSTSAAWNDSTRVRECELYDTFNDLLFPDPESGRL
ncbi:cilia- and flagella-associated protein 251-like [Patiria miniata]|uniref:Uncharacterized protein n=1 Tax=Patiria miniata TaxID=46514 RepID=A0A913Z7H8_PATMI|nr:cilia- and flagella-associated protein 251-like [Patiria miniata]